MLQDIEFDAQTKKTGRAGMVNGHPRTRRDTELPASTSRIQNGSFSSGLPAPKKATIPAVLGICLYSAACKQMNLYERDAKSFRPAPGLGEKLRAPLRSSGNQWQLGCENAPAGYMPEVRPDVPEDARRGELSRRFDPDAPFSSFHEPGQISHAPFRIRPSRAGIMKPAAGGDVEIRHALQSAAAGQSK